MSFRPKLLKSPLRHPETIESDDMRRPTWSPAFVILTLFFDSFIIQRRASPMVCGDDDGHLFLIVSETIEVSLAIQRQASPLARENPHGHMFFI